MALAHDTSAIIEMSDFSDKQETAVLQCLASNVLGWCFPRHGYGIKIRLSLSIVNVLSILWHRVSTE